MEEQFSDTGFVSVASITGSTFWRCGHQFQTGGEVFGPDNFTDAEWEVITADPWLKVSPAEAPPEPVDAEAQADAALDEAVLTAIANLTPEQFDKSGKPSLAALKAALPDHAGSINASVRDRVWEGVKPAEPTT
jgi:hypothetical protein